MKHITAWFFILALALLPLVLAATAQGATPLVDSLEQAQALVASQSEQAVDAHDLAEVIAREAKGKHDWAALLHTIAAHESRLSTRIAWGNCRLKLHECDNGRAWGLLQVHRTKANEAVWGSTQLAAQVHEGNRLLVMAYNTCNRGKRPEDWAARTINAYAGRSCSAKWPGLTERLNTWQKIKEHL